MPLDFLKALLPLRPRFPKAAVDTRLFDERLILRTGDPTDWHHWRNVREASRDFLVPWEPAWPANGMTYSYFCGLLRRQWRDWRQGRSYSFMIFLRRENEPQKEGALVGGIALNDVQRGIAQKGTLGYWVGQPYAGRGYMTDAARLVCDFAFQTLKLHRIEASCLPRNEPSINLLRRLGFEEEGFAKGYLQINGIWQDHILWGKNKEG